MPKKFEFATGGSGAGGAETKKINVVYPPEVQRKLDDAIGVVEKAGSAAERAAALKAYKQLVDEAAVEQQERMRLVDFRGEQIHNFELQALQKIVEQINEAYAEQRKVDPGFEEGDIMSKDISIRIRGKKIISIHLNENRLKTIPEAVGELINLQNLGLEHNRIVEVKGLESLTNLETLDLSCNRITEISGLERLIHLQTLWISDNPFDENTQANRVEIERLKMARVSVCI